MDLTSIGSAVRERRETLGLTQAQLAHMSSLSRQTIVGLEAGALADLGFNRVAQVLSILGLDTTVPTTTARDKKRGLWMAAKTASVSYSKELEPATLSHALASGEVPPTYVAHLAHLLDEAPLPVIVMAIEEAASREHVPPRRVWRNVAKLAKTLAISRQGVWA
jgi:transcriptional regulator with XRE-family HTH domain